MKSDAGANMVAGALAGLVATAPMTLAMVLMYRRLPAREKYPLPPSEITSKLSSEAGVGDNIDQAEHLGLTLAAHFGYGAATGALYGPLVRKVEHPLLGGIAYGLLVWSTSYLGLLPALQILRPATEHPARRNALMIGAHVVWGAALGTTAARFRRGPLLKTAFRKQNLKPDAAAITKRRPNT